LILEEKGMCDLAIRGLGVIVAAAGLLAFAPLAVAEDPWVTYEGGDGPGKGKHIVLVSGDEEYRSEEMMPQLGKILATHHGFKCTVLFAIDKASGEIAPTVLDNIPGLEALKTADLLVLFTRFRSLPEDQLKHIEEFVNAGNPVVGLRTATHAFNGIKGAYAKWNFNSKAEGFDGGFGRQVLGETWINHHGHHAKESTRAVVAKGQENNPIVKGCEDIWGPSDVYTVRLPQPEGCVPVLMGQVLEGMNPSDKPLSGATDPKKKNDPMMPVAWTKTYTGAGGKASRVFTTTMGCSKDFESEGFRRLMVNACYWAVGLEEKIPAKAKVDLVGEYKATPFGFGKFTKGLKPASLK
jgi:type 1 glutamine amidotransferase